MASNAKTALLCAYALASARRYAEAEALILSEPEAAKTAEALDLLARIRAEQGDAAEARRLWREILSAQPDNRAAKVALRNLGKRPRGDARWRWACAVAAALLAGLGAGLLLRGGAAAEPAEPVRLTWTGIPNARDLAALGAWKGQTARVTLGSAFFSDPARTAHRAVLTALVSQALGIPEEAVFLGKAPADAPEGSIRVELHRR